MGIEFLIFPYLYNLKQYFTMKKEKAAKRLKHLIAKYPVMEEVIKEQYAPKPEKKQPAKKAAPKKKTNEKS